MTSLFPNRLGPEKFDGPRIPQDAPFVSARDRHVIGPCPICTLSPGTVGISITKNPVRRS